MTIKDIEEMDDVLLSVAEAAKVLKVAPQVLRTTAKQRPELLGFPVMQLGSMVKIPREPFLKFIRG